MTPKQKGYQKQLLRRLHTSARYVNVYREDDALYREFLKETFGVQSSKDLSLDSLIRLVDYMELKGDLNAAKKAFKATANQVGFIAALWERNATFKDFFALMRLAKKLAKREIETLEELSQKEAVSLIAAIRRMKPPVAVNNPKYEGA